MNIVLLEPEIPANTGNIGRTCAATDSSLHLIGPLGFEVSDKQIKRAGLDYWKDLDVHYYGSYGEFLDKNPRARERLVMSTTKATHIYTDFAFRQDDYIMFGKESAGIPEDILSSKRELCVRIPMAGPFRSLNLSNSVAIVLYEALRQTGFEGLKLPGRGIL
ncbi:MAG: tRNA (cytidine(34)-2'-O)-methyltransferase [Defluviitaleaceae bacterium]|nr:tRNA (cytidine(34)-2'-O)-methyltransferase [Defluviitaleaceae bacterium]